MFLNGFKVELDSPTFTAYLQDLPENAKLRSLREQLKDSWFLYWQDGKVYGLPKKSEPEQEFGKPVKLNCNDHLRLLAARIADILPEKFPYYQAFRHRPFTFFAQKSEIVDSIKTKVEGLPDLVSSFKMRPKFELDAKLVELREGETFIGLFMRVRTRWEILAPICDLEKAGINVHGLYIVRRQPQPGQRRLVGKIGSISDETINLSESFDNITSINQSEVWLEGTKFSFARCLKTLLGNRYQEFEDERTWQEANFFTGPAMEKLLNTMEEFLSKVSPMHLAPDLNCSIGSWIEVANTEDYQTVISASSVEYCFDSARTKRTPYAWSGIDKYGPFSRETFAKKSPHILVIFPDTVQGTVESFLRYLRDGITFENGFSKYSGGFAKTFCLANPKLTLHQVPWLGNAKRLPAVVYREAVEKLLSTSNLTPDAAIVVVLDEHSRLPDPQNPYLQSKALLLMAGIPVQDIRVPTLSQSPSSLQYTLQNLSIALYAKMNGIPWTVDHDLTINDELVIGIGTCELSGSRFTERQRYIGITTVFRGDGNYLLGNLSKECSYAEYPQVLKDSTLSILQEIKTRNGWQPGDTIRLVFHASKPLKNVEVADIVANCVKEVGSEQNIEFAFLTVSHDHPFTLLDKSQPGIAPKYGKGSRKAVYVPERGFIVQLGRYTRLLCTNGPYLVKRERSPLPQPLLVRLHPQSTYRDLTYLTEQVLKFTSLSWRSTLPARKPVTIYYSELIAELLARLRSIPDWSPAMLNVKLRASKWFL